MTTSTLDREPDLVTQSLPKRRRLSWNKKLAVLDQHSSQVTIERRLEAFQYLFASRRRDGIVTRVGSDARNWTALRGSVSPGHIVRHLIADQAPSLKPQWVGCRSFPSSRFLCLDVDAERLPKQVDGSLRPQARNATRPSFLQRCAQVEKTLRTLGADPANPDEVLIQATPSGGKHYYVFFDGLYELDEYQDLLQRAGLRFQKGGIEFFPSRTQGLRLPFGFIPNQPHNSWAWIRFMDRYQSGEVKRFSLSKMFSRLWKKRLRAPQSRSKRSNGCDTSRRQSSTRSGLCAPLYLGTPKAERQRNETIAAMKSRYRILLEQGVRTRGEAEELLRLGIIEHGTRTTVLKVLAAHLVWFQNLTADEAAERLTAWALNPRHESNDIHRDLRDATTVVAQHIRRMCDWYVNHRDRKRNGGTSSHQLRTGAAAYSTKELDSLRKHLDRLPKGSRRHQAVFYLHLLAFTKKYGTPVDNGTAWEVALAINAVVRKWPDCHHMHYKERLALAGESEALVLVKEKWQNPKGKGRARTYRLAVPVSTDEENCVDYPTALAQLTMEVRVGDNGIVDDNLQLEQKVAVDHASEPNDHAQVDCPQFFQADDEAALCAASTGANLDEGPRKRTAFSDEAPGLRRAGLGTVPADSAAGTHGRARLAANVQCKPQTAPLRYHLSAVDNAAFFAAELAAIF